MATIESMRVHPRPAARKPLYAQVREQLLARIRGGEWTAGECLPNEYVLSTDFAVSIGTVRRAVSDLELSGVLVREQGRGTYVSGRGAAALEQKFAVLCGHGGERLALTYDLVSVRQREATASEAEGLKLWKPQPSVVEVCQRVELEGSPLGIEVSVLPSQLVPRIETQLRFGQHLYPLLADYGLLVTRVEDMVGVEPADQQCSSRLDCGDGEALLVVRRRAFGLDGQAVEWRTGRYLPAKARYVGAFRVI